MPWPCEDEAPKQCSAQGDRQEVPDFIPPDSDSEVGAGCFRDRDSMVDEVILRF